MLKLTVKTADLQRQVADYQTTVSSLSQTLDDVNAQLNDSRQKLRDSGIHTLCTPSIIPDFYLAMHYSAMRGIAIACRPSPTPSVCL